MEIRSWLIFNNPSSPLSGPGTTLGILGQQSSTMRHRAVRFRSQPLTPFDDSLKSFSLQNTPPFRLQKTPWKKQKRSRFLMIRKTSCLLSPYSREVETEYFLLNAVLEVRFLVQKNLCTSCRLSVLHEGVTFDPPFLVLVLSSFRSGVSRSFRRTPLRVRQKNVNV